MKINRITASLSLTAALAGLIACAASCAKKSSAPDRNLVPPPRPAPTNSVADHPASTHRLAPVAIAPAVTPDPVPVPLQVTNPPPAEFTGLTPQSAPMTATNLPGHAEVVEMPTNPPVPPKEFYPPAITAPVAPNFRAEPVAERTNFFISLRGGYEHLYHGDNNDTFRTGLKLSAYGDGWREAAGKNAWLVPDLAAELASGTVAKSDNPRHRGSDDGLQFRADFTWPWIHWTTLMFARSNSVCPFCQPLAMGLGPTVNLGLDHLYNESDYRFACYAGLRLTFNRSGFIEYTVGDTEGLAGTRQQIVAELPFYQTPNGVRYYLRGLWNHGSSSQPDILEGGLFIEIPLTTLVKPGQWGDLIPFWQH